MNAATKVAFIRGERESPSPSNTNSSKSIEGGLSINGIGGGTALPGVASYIGGGWDAFVQ